jgi:hypothetical protein
MKKTFKPGDYVFVRDKHGALQSTKVWGTTNKRVIVANWQPLMEEDERGRYAPPERYVSYDKVILQSDWEKENT